MFELGS